MQENKRNLSLENDINSGYNKSKKGIYMNSDEAYLSNDEKYTVFKYGDFVIRFAAPYSLQKYTRVKEWDNGYLVVDAKYKYNTDPEEEYIDLIPVLNNLYLDAEKFLKPIKKVRVLYD